jgi:WXXGXW repeat (2 copies)
VHDNYNLSIFAHYPHTMNNRFWTPLFALTLTAMLLALSACAIPDDDQQPMVQDTAVSSPPQPQLEYIPAVDDPQTQIWRPGFWVLSGTNSFSWVPGKIIPRPSPTAVWASAHWSQHAYGWSFEQGHWE